MFVHSVVCVTHWSVEYCWVYCGHADEGNLLLAAIPRLLLDVLLVFRDGHYSQETLALYAEVGTGAASCCSEHLSTEWQQHSTVHTMENVQLIFVNLIIFMVTNARQVRKCIHSTTDLAHWLLLSVESITFLFA